MTTILVEGRSDEAALSILAARRGVQLPPIVVVVVSASPASQEFALLAEPSVGCHEVAPALSGFMEAASREASIAPAPINVWSSTPATSRRRAHSVVRAGCCWLSGVS